MPIRSRPLAAARLLLAALPCAASLLVSAARAQQAESQAAAPKDTADAAYGLVPHKFTFGIGGYLPRVTSHSQLSSATRGTDISFEQMLGLEPNNQSLQAIATWRITRKQLLTLEYFGFNRSATKQLNQDITFRDTVYQAGLTLDAKTGLEYYGLTYRFYFWRKTRWEVGAGLGIDALSLSANLGINVALSGGSGSHSGTASTKGSLVAPAPMLGLYGDWEFAPKMFARGTFQYLYVNNVSGYGATVSDDNFAVEWYPLHNYGVGLSYHYVFLTVSKTVNADEFQLHYTVQGPSLYITAAF